MGVAVCDTPQAPNMNSTHVYHFCAQTALAKTVNEPTNIIFMRSQIEKKLDNFEVSSIIGCCVCSWLWCCTLWLHPNFCTAVCQPIKFEHADHTNHKLHMSLCPWDQHR